MLFEQLEVVSIERPQLILGIERCAISASLAPQNLTLLTSLLIAPVIHSIACPRPGQYSKCCPDRVRLSRGFRRQLMHDECPYNDIKSSTHQLEFELPIVHDVLRRFSSH